MTSPVRRILVPVDCSSCSRQALEFACSMAAALGAAVEVLYVSPRGDEASLATAREELREFLASVPASGVVRKQSVEAGDPRERIISTAERERFDMIVLGTHGRTGRPRMLAGSVAEGVVRTSACPVVTVRGDS